MSAHSAVFGGKRIKFRLLNCSLFIAVGFFSLPGNAPAEDIVLQGDLEPGLYVTEDNIVTQNACTVKSGTEVVCVAGTRITLNPGFSVELGGRFEAKVGGFSDSDGDGLPDWWEDYYFGNWSHDCSAGALGDPDGDGLNNCDEYESDANPTMSDSDSDGASDYLEYVFSTDPNDGGDVPPPGNAYEDIDHGLLQDEQQGGGGLLSDSVRLINGNVIERRTDMQFPSPHRHGFHFEAFYNSRSNNVGALGYGWTHTYSARLNPSYGLGNATFLKIVDQTGRASYFLHKGDGIYTGVLGEFSHVEFASGNYTWYRLDGMKYVFDFAGSLISIQDPAGNTIQLSYDTNGRLQTVTDNSSSRSLTFSYNASGLIDHIVGPTSDAVTDGKWVEKYVYSGQDLTEVVFKYDSGVTYVGTRYTYDENHNLIGKENALGGQVNAWEYDALDRATSGGIEGREVEIEYASGTSAYVKDAYDTVRVYELAELDGRKRVVSISSTSGPALPYPYSHSNATGWEYDGLLRLKAVYFENGGMISYEDYDDRANPHTVKIKVSPEVTREIQFTYHPDMNAPLTRTEPSVLGAGNKVTTWDYDNDYDSIPNENPTELVGRVVEQGFTKDESNNTIPYEYVTTLTYNAKGQVLSINGPLDGSDDSTIFSYESITGDLQSIERPQVGDTVFLTQFTDYDPAGEVGRVTLEDGRYRDFRYDRRGRITEIFYFTSSGVSIGTETISYNDDGKMTGRTDLDGVVTAYEYHPNGRLSRLYDHDGNYIEYLYDAYGNKTEENYYDNGSPPELKRSKAYIYEAAGHNMPGKLFKVVNPEDLTDTRYTYDTEGNVASVTDPRGNTTSYFYNLVNQLVRVEEPAPGSSSPITMYQYDLHGNLVSVTDAGNVTTTYQYDDLGRLVQTVSQDAGTLLYVYDKGSRVVKKIDSKGIEVTYGYDLHNRLRTASFPEYGLQPAYSINYTYDSGTYAKGKLTGMTDAAGNTTYGYDDHGRLTTKTHTVNGHSVVSRILCKFLYDQILKEWQIVTHLSDRV